MPLTYQSSDVYVEEVDLSQIPTTISTSIGGIVFASRKGPVYRQLVTNQDDFIQKYGQPDASISFGHYVAIAFLQESDQLWCVRAIGDGALWGGLALQKRQTPPTDPVPVFRGAAVPDPDTQGVDFDTLAGAGSTFDNLAFFYALGPGSYSEDISIEIQSDNLSVPTNVSAYDFATVGVIIAGVDAAGIINPGTYDYIVTAQNAVGETMGSSIASVTITVSGTSIYISWDAVPGATQYNIYGRVSGPLFGYCGTVGGGTFFYVDGNTDMGTTNTPDINRQPPASQTYTNQFTVLVYDATVSANQPQEQYTCTFYDEVNGLGQQLELQQAINPYSKLIHVISNAGSFTPATIPAVFSIAKTPLEPGDSGAAVTNGDINQGWDLLSDPEELELRLMINGGYSTPSVQLHMDQIAHARHDAVCILDVPSASQEFQAAIDYRNINLNLSSNRSALYTPDLLIDDSFNNKVLYVPPSGHVAAVYAFTDAVTYPWFAPAGLNRGLLSVLGVRYKYNRGQRDALWAAQIDYVRNFPGLGRAVFEQRTLQAALSGYSFMNVRRLMDFIEISLSRACMFQLFEPNDDFTRLQVRTICEQFLESVKRARGINQYLVVCDKRNNPPQVTGNGQLNVDIFVEPTLPAEKIRLRTILTRQGANFEELISAGALF